MLTHQSIWVKLNILDILISKRKRHDKAFIFFIEKTNFQKSSNLKKPSQQRNPFLRKTEFTRTKQKIM